jgi:two-component system, sensor histidine kinase LadS
LRDRVYLLWLILIVVMTGQAFMVSGLGYLYLDWADLRYVNKITNGFTVLTIGMNVLFASTLFNFQALHRWLHRSIAIWLVLTLAVLSYAIWHSLWFFRGLALNAALMMMVAFVGIVGQMLRRDSASLRYGPMFLLSFAAGMVTVLAINGTLVAYSELTASTWRAGSICNLLSLQVAMFSRALEAKRKHARERAQLFEQLEQQNLELEARVAQRTESLSKALQDVQQAELSQRKLLTMASHEFRTPAAWIKASIDSLAILKDEVPAAVALRLTNMRQASLRMIGLANDLINEDRLHELSLQPRMAAMDLCQLVTEVVAVYPQKSEIAVSVPNEAVPITGDAALLRIALHNLLDNALRHGATDAGERQRIEVSLIRDNGQIQVRVADNGPGIADSKKQWVFERYHAQPYRDSADDDARVSVSSGLGLSIVREIAQAHAGTATVHDRPQGGAVFSIGLPA